MELSLSAAPFDRLRNRMSRRLIEHLDPRLAALPLAEGYPASPLRPWNAYRFLLPAGRMAMKIGGARLGFGSNRASGGRLNLWEVDEVCSLLEPSSMLSRDLYEPKALKLLIAESRTKPIERAQPITRILTLEMLARMVNEV